MKRVISVARSPYTGNYYITYSDGTKETVTKERLDEKIQKT